jgi:hypothetical protein
MESAELLRRIRNELLQKTEQPTEGWKTAKQWMGEWGLHQSQTTRLLQRAVDAGIMEVRPFRMPCSNRSSYPIPHYREIKTGV